MICINASLAAKRSGKTLTLRSRRRCTARAGGRIGYNRRVSISGGAVRQVSPIDIDGREANDAATAVTIHGNRYGLRLGARAGLVARQVVGQRGEVCRERQARQRLGRPLLLSVTPVPLLDPEPGPSIRDDAQQAVWVAVAIE